MISVAASISETEFQRDCGDNLMDVSPGISCYHQLLSAVLCCCSFRLRCSTYLHTTHTETLLFFDFASTFNHINLVFYHSFKTSDNSIRMCFCQGFYHGCTELKELCNGTLRIGNAHFKNVAFPVGFLTDDGTQKIGTERPYVSRKKP